MQTTTYTFTAYIYCQIELLKVTTFCPKSENFILFLAPSHHWEMFVVHASDLVSSNSSVISTFSCKRARFCYRFLVININLHVVLDNITSTLYFSSNSLIFLIKMIYNKFFSCTARITTLLDPKNVFRKL